VRQIQADIHRFNEKHDVTEDQQFKMLCEEVGELAEALNTGSGDERVAEEGAGSQRETSINAGNGEIASALADVIFVARSLAELRDINITHEVAAVTEENLAKDESTDGQKVTKATSGTDTGYGVTD